LDGKLWAMLMTGIAAPAMAMPATAARRASVCLFWGCFTYFSFGYEIFTVHEITVNQDTTCLIFSP
jgi:hypothetical protein